MLANIQQMSSPRKEVMKEDKGLKDKDKENPTNIGPGVTESYEV
jgi:hypothetical protein